MSPTPRFPLVFVLGVAHCGSTLLGRLLNMHPQVLCVGEMARIDLTVKGNLPCGCGEQLLRCSFWSPLLPEIEAASRYDFRRFTPDLYARIREACGKDVVVDLSKTRVYRMARRWRAGEGYLFLIRDPRGVLASAVRAGKDLGEPLRKYRKWMRKLGRFVSGKEDRTLLIYYEDLVNQPASELRRICDFLGLGFTDAVLRPADKTHHFIHSSVSDYLKNSNEIRLDQRWRKELTPEQVLRIVRAIDGWDLLERYTDV